MQNGKDVNIHRGHRDRLRKRFLKNNGRDFEDHELLEMLLCYVIPRANTNGIAHSLINEFGSLRDALNADPKKIERVDGAGKATSTFFSLLFAIRKRIDLQKYDSSKFVADSLTKVGNYFIDYFRDLQHEELCVMLLDNSLKLIEIKSFTSGSACGVGIDIREITRYALSENATHVVLAHNHPSGLLIPSAEDRHLTSSVEAAFFAVGITLLEHIIVNNVCYKPTLHMRALTAGNQDNFLMYKKFYDRT